MVKHEIRCCSIYVIMLDLLEGQNRALETWRDVAIGGDTRMEVG